MKIYIRTLEGRSTEITVNGSDTISKGKQIYKTVSNKNINPSWKFNGIVLKDDKTFNFYEIEEEDNIISNERVEGGNNK